jgi:hypothetical protein
MSKQRPDADKLASEFAGASAFFRRPAQQQPEPQAEPEPTPPPAAAVTREEPVKDDVVTSRRQRVTTSDEFSKTDGFDINRPTASRDSLRLSMDETRALDELKSALKWDYDLTVTKNDICRVALHALLEDYRAKGDRISVVARLKRKQTSR